MILHLDPRPRAEYPDELKYIGLPLRMDTIRAASADIDALRREAERLDERAWDVRSGKLVPWGRTAHLLARAQRIEDLVGLNLSRHRLNYLWSRR